jgi:hypothetical protein
MRLIHENVNNATECGSITFEWKGHVYMVGEDEDGEDFAFMQRQSLENYNNQLDGWEEAEWHDVDKPPFKFLRKERNFR